MRSHAQEKQQTMTTDAIKETWAATDQRPWEQESYALLARAPNLEDEIATLLELTNGVVSCRAIERYLQGCGTKPVSQQPFKAIS